MTDENALVAGLEVLTSGSQAPVADRAANDGFSMEAAEAETVRHDHQEWIHGDGVQGLGIGNRIVAGTLVPELAVRVYVEKKKPLSMIENPAPKTVTLPSIGQIELDVIEIGLLQLESFTSRVRPTMPGCSVGHSKITAGTLGLVVRHEESGEMVILSNSHVLANEGDATQGDHILQPGQLDGGQIPDDVIGDLVDWVPFEFSDTGFTNLVDAAIASVSREHVIDAIRLIDVTPVKVNAETKRGDVVRKVGRTTDETTGVVQDVNAKLKLEYRVPGAGGTKKRVGLTDQVLCTRYTQSGDSGAAVLNDRDELVGLHFAGSSSASVFNKIGNVFTLLKLRLD